MNFVPAGELVSDAALRGYAVPSFCAWNTEAMKTILDVAEELRAPVMVMNGWAEFPIITPEILASISRALIWNSGTGRKICGSLWPMFPP